MSQHPDVLIVGGGVIGLTTAYFLAREGFTVRVLDRSEPGSEASWAGAGIVPPGNPARAATAYDRLRAFSSSLFPALSAELRERTGIDNGYRVCGGIEVFERDAAAIAGLWQSEGIPFHALTAAAAQGVEPAFRLADGEAYFLPGMAQVRNPWHLRALREACQQAGAEVTPSRAVVRFRAAGDRTTAAETESGEEHPAGSYLIAAGAWSERLLSQLGHRPGVHPVRGQMVLYRCPRPPIRSVIGVGKRYLVPREDGLVLVGSTEEPEAGFDKRTTDEGIGGLTGFATSFVPELALAPIEKTWAGLRPGTPDGSPFLGPVPGWTNVFAATGHFRAGIQLSPGTAQLMADLLTHCPASVPIAEFRLGRPPARPVPTAFRS
ncbi:MAG TPA: glycine oxidase ThiO [Gemmataceae bacterium]|nr:glycine oxidase ThiO [Gemmataceae bacterium]